MWIASSFGLIASLVTVGVFAGMLVLLEVGRRLGSARLARDSEGGRAGQGAVEGAVYGLLGLLLAFTFSGAASRFEERRRIVVHQANAIGTAYLRLDLLDPEPRAALQEKFRRCLDARIEAYRKLPDVEAAYAGLTQATSLQGEIWTEAVAASQAKGGPIIGLVLGALNEMIDITTTETAATRAHPPLAVFAMLAAMALVSALLTGYAMAAGKRRSAFHMLAYAAVLSTAIYVILDYEYPRIGLIRVDEADQLLVQVRAGMR